MKLRTLGIQRALAICALLQVAVAYAGDALDRAEARARELCVRMTLEEKAGELMVYDYMDLGPKHWHIYTNMVCRNEIGAMMRVHFNRFSDIIAVGSAFVSPFGLRLRS